MGTLVKDLICLVKPTILLLSVIMGGMGIALAPEATEFSLTFFSLLGIGMLVGAANSLNMVIERDVDPMMARTRKRPVAAGRLSPHFAAAYGILLGITGLGLLHIFANALSSAIGLASLIAYVLIYTPLKQRTPLALIIGAFPGAAPPLMGWTAATGTIDLPGLVVFGIVLLWQIPHFLAISLYRKEDYIRAGIRSVPNVRGDRVAKLQAIAYCLAMIPLSVLLVPLGSAGWIYGVGALGCSLWFFWVCIRNNAPTQAWAKKLFLASLGYLPLLCVIFAIDRMLL